MSGFVPFGKRLEERLNKARPRLLRCLRGEESCDYRVKGAAVFNSFTGKIKPVDIWLADGFIVYTGNGETAGEQLPFPSPMTARETYDASGLLALPGFVDAHMHVESTMLTPRRLGRVLALTGTTTIITDPHEMVNVAGEEGLRYMLDNSEDSPVRQINLVPSCVPAAPGLEHSGTDWTAKEIAAVFDWGHPRIGGLAEAMSYLDIINSRERMSAILKAALDRGAFIQGHCFGLRGRTLAAYVLAGGQSNHENLNGADVAAAIEAGFPVDIRLTSSLVDDQVRDLVQGLAAGRGYDQVSACTDDVHIRDILREGHLNLTVKTLVDNGIAPQDAIKIASLNVWRNFGVRHAGVLAASYLGDIQLLPLGGSGREFDFLGKRPQGVFVDGKPIVWEGKLLSAEAARDPAAAGPSAAFERRNFVNLPSQPVEAFLVRPPAAKPWVTLCAICYPTPNVINTAGTISLPVTDGVVSIEGRPDLAWIKVFNRYGRNTVGTALVQGYPLKEGAIASTISHDCHNVTVIYREGAPASKAVNALIECGGGIAYVDGKGALTVLSLPVGGLISAEEPEMVAEAVEKIETAYRAANGKDAPLMNVVVMALPVVPVLRVSDLGIVDVLAQKVAPLFLEP
jgi:adenine deaminase